MKNISLAIALAFASLATAQAQDMSNAQYGEPAVAPAGPAGGVLPEKQMRFFIGIGYTNGGDEIATLYYNNGDNGDVTFGGETQLAAGVDYRITNEFSLQASINSHISSQGADNGSVRFTRMPIELIAHYKIAPQWRLGAGARYVGSAKIKSKGVASGLGNYDVKNTIGSLVEAEYLFGKFGFKMRYVVEKYELELGGGKNDGNHFGLFGNYYF
jgi:hypothetical protein